MKTPMERALDRLMQEEGGFVNDPKDPGGATNMGITLATLRACHWDVNNDGEIDATDIRDLQPDQARSIARSRYWDRCRCDELPSLVNELVFDFAYHSGPTAAIKGLQRAAGIVDDGLIGTGTLHAVCQQTSDEMACRVMDERNRLLVRSIDPRTGQPLWPVYGKGWNRRLFRLHMDVSRVV